MYVVIVMITVDRGERGRRNYFRQTMEGFSRSGLWNSKTPFEFHVYDSGSQSLDYIGTWSKATNITVHGSWFKVSPKLNAGRALLAGSEYPSDWVIFVEDDILVCKDFLDGTVKFIEQHATSSYRVLSFYTPYREVEIARLKGEKTWEYPVPSFYGTQCLAFRREDAKSCGYYILSDTEYDANTPSYDLIMKDWHKSAYPDNPYFLASVPSFVQHIGEESYLFEQNRFHQCQSFLGEQWSAL